MQFSVLHKSRNIIPSKITSYMVHTISLSLMTSNREASPLGKNDDLPVNIHHAPLQSALVDEVNTL